MTAKPEPTTWKILPTKGGEFQWVVTSGNPDSGPERPTATLVLEEDINSKSRLPSMLDILIQAEQSNYLSNNTWFHDRHLAVPLKPVEMRGDNGGGGAMFSTGSGRRLSVQRSSILKARSILEQEDVVDKASCGSECFPMFRTGLGNSVQVKQSSIKKAEALLEVSDDNEEHNMHEPSDTRSFCPPLKFQTACGRSISLSADALKRARNLLNELELDALEGEAKANPSTYSSVENDKIYNESSCNLKRISFGISPSVKQFCSPLMAPTPSRMIRGSRAAPGVLVDISNYPGSSLKNKSWINGEKKRLGKESSSSSFKRPRTSRFTAPLNHSSSSLAETAMPSSSVNCCCRARVSSRYPFQVKRKKLKEFFGAPPGQVSKFENIPDRIRFMTPDSAEKYRFHDTCYSVEFGPDAFWEMLVQSGALLADTSEKWVANHYKWIVWKLACLERSYPNKAIGKLLTVCNVLEELKYRYEREVNYGHKSTIKKILDGDVSPSSMMTLCVSAIHSYSGSRNDEVLVSFDLHGNQRNPIGIGSNHAAKIELTDGWYSLDATLDGHLSKELLAGKLFVGQKLRVCGAAFCGWVEPISPLEASNSVSLVLHINGTYRAHWADSLGLCRGIGAPLAFRCIKDGGGKIPKTLVGVTRLYPVLYKERLQGGGSIVRSESMEKKILELNNRRLAKWGVSLDTSVLVRSIILIKE